MWCKLEGRKEQRASWVKTATPSIPDPVCQVATCICYKSDLRWDGRLPRPRYLLPSDRVCQTA